MLLWDLQDSKKSCLFPGEPGWHRQPGQAQHQRGPIQTAMASLPHTAPARPSGAAGSLVVGWHGACASCCPHPAPARLVLLFHPQCQMCCCWLCERRSWDTVGTAAPRHGLCGAEWGCWARRRLSCPISMPHCLGTPPPWAVQGQSGANMAVSIHHQTHQSISVTSGQ